MKETHFQKWFNTIWLDEYEGAGKDTQTKFTKFAWNAAIQLAVFQLKSVGRFAAAEQIKHLLEGEKDAVRTPNT